MLLLKLLQAALLLDASSLSTALEVALLLQNFESAVVYGTIEPAAVPVVAVLVLAAAWIVVVVAVFEVVAASISVPVVVEERVADVALHREAIMSSSSCQKNRCNPSDFFWGIWVERETFSFYSFDL